MAQLSEAQMHERTGPEPDPGEALSRREDAAEVLRLLDKLPPNQREVIRLRFQDGFSYKEISRISGQSVANVGYLMHAGMKALRGRLVATETLH